jgi:hypothetical protein
MSGRQNIEANSIHRFYPERFRIKPDLLGAQHSFTHSGRQVSVALPQSEEINRPRHLRRVVCDVWRTEGRVPLEYQVNEVTVRIAVGHPLAVPEEALKVAPRRDHLFTEFERNQLAQLIEEHAALAVDAFRYWLSVLRWKSKIGEIGEPQVKLPDQSSGGSALQESATGHRFWLDSIHIVAHASGIVNSSNWQSAQEALSESRSPPIWFDFIFQAQQRINNHDLIGAVLSLAIALEAIIRTLVTHNLSTQNVEPLICDIVDRANLRSILNRIKTLSLWNDEWKRQIDFGAFNELMNYRDRVMHSADTGT